MGVDHETRIVGDPAHAVVHAIDGTTTYDVCDERSDAYDTDACDATAANGFWLLAGNGPSFESEVLGDFDEITLNTGDRIVLTYLDDRDGDDLFDREEYLLGTNPEAKDTDGDDLSDFDEAKVGWEVPIYSAGAGPGVPRSPIRRLGCRWRERRERTCQGDRPVFGGYRW